MRKTFQGRVVPAGTVKAEALVSHGGFNTLASFQMPMLLGDKKVRCSDQNNPDLYQKSMLGKAICLPETIGSTTGGMALYTVCATGKQPACLLFSKHIDSLAAAGDTTVAQRNAAVDMGVFNAATVGESRLLSIALILVIMLFILSASIRAVIIFRPFYYAHIEPMGLAERGGITEQETKQAYDDMMDYCLGYTDTFKTGVLHWSPAGKAHFDDCRFLFALDNGIMLVTSVLLLAFIMVMRRLPVRPRS